MSTGSILNGKSVRSIITIPKPILNVAGEQGNGNAGYLSGGGNAYHFLTLHFLPCDLSWTLHKPTIFMFRYRNYQKRGGRKVRGWVHPTDYTMTNAGVWTGSNLYNGLQWPHANSDIEARRSEWLLGMGLNATTHTDPVTHPSQLLPYGRKEIPYNLNQFWKTSSGGAFDHVTFPITKSSLDNSEPAYTQSGKMRTPGQTWAIKRVPKNYQIRFAYVIHNPNYDGVDPTQPRILMGEMSDVLHIYMKLYSGEYTKFKTRIGYSAAWTI